MIIAIEGHDGVGKTTLAKALASRLGFRYVKHQVKDILGVEEDKCLEIMKNVIKTGNEKLVAWFLAFNDMCALGLNENAVLDRHSLLNYYWNGNENTEEIFRLSQKLFGRPDLTILLTASDAVRVERIRKRDGNDEDLQNSGIVKADSGKLIGYLEKYEFNYSVIDTDNLSEKEVEDMAAAEIMNFAAIFNS